MSRCSEEEVRDDDRKREFENDPQLSTGTDEENITHFKSSLLENFEILEFLGKGRFGNVFRVRDKNDDCEYAVKRIPMTDVDKMSGEYDFLTRLNHPGIIKYYHTWIEKPPFGWKETVQRKKRNPITFEALDSSTTFFHIKTEVCNASLDRWMNENWSRDGNDVKWIFKQIVSALEYIHRQHLIHRDLKPSHILLGENNHIKISGFGSESHSRWEMSNGIPEDFGVTMYWAPEQSSGVYSSSVDVFSMGLILAEMTLPMDETKCAELFHKLRAGYGTCLPQNLSPDVRKMVVRLTEKDAKSRPSCVQILETIANYWRSDATDGTNHSFSSSDSQETGDLELMRKMQEGLGFSPQIDQKSIDEFKSSLLENFEILEFLGKGTFGNVFRVRDKNDDCEYAVKRIPRTDVEMEKISDEIISLSRLDHPGIVKYYHTWNEKPPFGWEEAVIMKKDEKPFIFGAPNSYTTYVYIKTEVCNSSLEQWMKDNPIRNVNKVKLMFNQIVSAVAYIHKQKRIHRDLKPANILLKEKDQIKICDFGITTESNLGRYGLRTGNMGTPVYMAPEQSGIEYFCSVDIFTMGLILTEMATFMTMIEAERMFNSFRAGIVPQLSTDLPIDIKEMIIRLTRKDAIDRPTCKEILKMIGKGWRERPEGVAQGLQEIPRGPVYKASPELQAFIDSRVFNFLGPVSVTQVTNDSKHIIYADVQMSKIKVSIDTSSNTFNSHGFLIHNDLQATLRAQPLYAPPDSRGVRSIIPQMTMTFSANKRDLTFPPCFIRINPGKMWRFSPEGSGRRILSVGTAYISIYIHLPNGVWRTCCENLTFLENRSFTLNQDCILSRDAY